jgi:hypothetical protein
MHNLFCTSLLAINVIPPIFALDASQVTGSWRIDIDAMKSDSEQQKAEMGRQHFSITATEFLLKGNGNLPMKIESWTSVDTKTASIKFEYGGISKFVLEVIDMF